MDKKDKFYRKFSTHEEQLAAAELFNKSFVDCQKEEQKPECDLHFYKTEDGYCMKGCGYKFPDGYSPEGMQPECDHIVGYIEEKDEFGEYKNCQRLDDVKDLYGGIHPEWLTQQFKVCPLCEKKLDLEEIEKKLNLKKDE